MKFNKIITLVSAFSLCVCIGVYSHAARRPKVKHEEYTPILMIKSHLDVVGRLNDFACRLYQQEAKCASGNFVTSPLGIIGSLLFAAESVSDEARDEIYKVLGLDIDSFMGSEAGFLYRHLVSSMFFADKNSQAIIENSVWGIKGQQVANGGDIGNRLGSRIGLTGHDRTAEADSIYSWTRNYTGNIGRKEIERSMPDDQGSVLVSLSVFDSYFNDVFLKGRTNEDFKGLSGRTKKNKNVA